MTAWKTVKLSEVCEIQRGGSPRPIEQYMTEADDGVNWIKIGDVAEGAKYITSTREKIRPEGVQRSRQVSYGDFLLSNSMSFGRPYILRTSGCIHDGWLVLRYDKTKLTEDFLYHVLSSDFVYAQFVKFAVGAVVKNLNSEIVKNVSITLPSLPEQRRIAAILDQADALRAKRREALAQLDSLTQSIFIEMFGDPLSVTDAIAHVPFESITSRITYGFTSPMTHLDHGIPILTAKNVLNGALDLQKVHYADQIEFDALTSKSKPKRGDILVTKDGTIGRCAVVDTDATLCINQSVALVQLLASKVIPAYVVGYLSSDRLQAVMKNMSKGNSLAHLQITELAKLPIPLPHMSAQREFANRIGCVENLKVTQSQSALELDTLFASLQHSAFRGNL